MLEARRLVIALLLVGVVGLIGAGPAAADTYWGLSAPIRSALPAVSPSGVVEPTA